ncbi:hypothetical protein HK102_007710 [Quaeritorhiza haematococci]|nr:hypothetical protein HK102_007710 [Quaeritorhiza haematococci]
MPTNQLFSVSLVDTANNRRPFSEFIPPTLMHRQEGAPRRMDDSNIVTCVPPRGPGTRFAIRVRNLGLRVSSPTNPPSSPPTPSSSPKGSTSASHQPPTISKSSGNLAPSVEGTPSLVFIVFVDGDPVYARLLPRPGETRDVEGRRVGPRQLLPFQFKGALRRLTGSGRTVNINEQLDSDGGDADSESEEHDRRFDSTTGGKRRQKTSKPPPEYGTIRVEVWKTKIAKRLDNVVPIWPAQSSESQPRPERNRSSQGVLKKAAVSVPGEFPVEDCGENPTVAVICYRDGELPLISFTIVYDTDFDPRTMFAPPPSKFLE